MKKLIIYYTEDKKNYRVVQPTQDFNGDYEGLVKALSPQDRHGKPLYYSYSTI